MTAAAANELPAEDVVVVVVVEVVVVIVVLEQERDRGSFAAITKM